jgi:hypothetical protein
VGQDDESLIPAICVLDVLTGEQERWFSGPKGSLVFDDYLFSYDQNEGTSVCDIATGERLVKEIGFFPAGYHRGAKHFVSLLRGGSVQVSRLVQGVGVKRRSRSFPAP